MHKPIAMIGKNANHEMPSLVHQIAFLITCGMLCQESRSLRSFPRNSTLEWCQVEVQRPVLNASVRLVHIHLAMPSTGNENSKCDNRSHSMAVSKSCYWLIAQTTQSLTASLYPLGPFISIEMPW